MTDMREDGALQKFTFPPSRLSTMDVCALGRKKHHVTALIEIDVTEARAIFHSYKARCDESLSFTAWVVSCVAAAAAEYPQAAACRWEHR